MGCDMWYVMKEAIWIVPPPIVSADMATPPYLIWATGYYTQQESFILYILSGFRCVSAMSSWNPDVIFVTKSLRRNSHFLGTSGMTKKYFPA